MSAKQRRNDSVLIGRPARERGRMPEHANGTVAADPHPSSEMLTT
jgi:hypothetical protein